MDGSDGFATTGCCTYLSGFGCGGLDRYLGCAEGRGEDSYRAGFASGEDEALGGGTGWSLVRFGFEWIGDSMRGWGLAELLPFEQ